MPETKDKATLIGVTHESANVANSGPAPWANKFVITIGPMVRIAFLEQGGPEEPEYFRGAVAMAHQDAIALKNLLTALLVEVEKQIEAAQQRAAGAMS
jgi:hypothetical protein